MLVERISPEDTSGTVRTIATLTMDLTSVNWFVLSTVDLSTCVVVHHLLVFYYVCPAETSTLITRPETIAPESAIPGQCAENSSPTSSGEYRGDLQKLLALLPYLTLDKDGQTDRQADRQTDMVSSNCGRLQIIPAST